MFSKNLKRTFHFLLKLSSNLLPHFLLNKNRKLNVYKSIFLQYRLVEQATIYSE